MFNKNHSWNNSGMRFTRTICSFHLAIVCLVTIQLTTELFMKLPKPGESVQEFEALFLLIHEWDGFIALGIVVFYLMHLADGSDEWKRIFPWMSAPGRKGIWRELCVDVPGWFRGKLKSSAEARYIAGTVHGLGILLIVALGATGTMIFIGIEPDGNMDRETKLLKDLHSDLGDMIWIYFLAHSGMALIHQVAGHRVFQNIFNFKANREDI